MRPCDETKPYIFISYSHADTKKVMGIIDRLTDAGFNVWYDGGIDPGTEWDENIAYHVESCAYFIAFVSEKYINSKNCKDELNFSRDLDKEQLLVYFEDVDLPRGMAMRMNRLQAIYWNKYEDEDMAFDKLFKANGIENALLSKTEGVTVEAYKPTKSSVKSKTKKKFPTLIVAIIAAVLVIGGAVAAIVITSANKDKYLTDAVDYMRAGGKYEVNYDKAINLLSKAEDKKDMEGVFLEAYALYVSYENKLDAEDKQEKYVRLLEMSADEVPYSKLLLGYLYTQINSGVDRNFDTANELWEEALADINEGDLLTDGKIKCQAEACHILAIVLSNKNNNSCDYQMALKYAEKAKDLGNTYADNELGVMYYYGYGVEVDKNIAREHFKEAYDNKAGLINYALTYYKGDGVEQDYKKAFDLYMEGVDKGSLKSIERVGNAYCYGRGVDKDYDKALEYYKKAAEGGFTDAMCDIAVCYSNGWGVEQNYDEALNWYKKAAALYDDNAMYKIGALYWNGKGVEQSYENAMEWDLKAAEYNNPGAMNDIGVLYANGYGVEKSDVEAQKWYDKASDAGSVTAIVNNGIKYLNGGEGIEKDPEKAMEYFKRAADQDSGRAYYYIGKIYDEGLGYEENKEKAFENYLQAADLEYADAYYKLGVMCNDGTGCDKNVGDAYNWFKKGDEAGNSNCTYRLARMYLNGTVVEKDVNQAITYYDKAANAGNGSAAYELGDLYNKGEVVNKDTSKAIDYFNKALENNNLDGYIGLLDVYYGNKDYTKALEYAKLSYEKQGNYKALYMMGWIYQGSYVGEPNYEEARKCFEIADKAADAAIDKNKQPGYTTFCSKELGVMYRDGKGVEADADKAIYYFERSVNNKYYKDMSAYLALGDMYRDGKIVDKDIDKAKEYYQLGADAGNKECKERLEELK